MAATIINNVGWIQGQNGKGIIYLGKTSGGVEFLTVRMAASVDPNVLGTFKFMPKSNVLGAIGSGDAVIVTTVSVATMPDVAPDGLLSAGGDIDFGATALDNYPRIHENQAFYSVLSQENRPTDFSLITQANISAGAQIQYVASKAPSASAFSFSVDDIVTWVETNLLLSLGIAFLAMEALGITNVTGIFGKKKTVRRR